MSEHDASLEKESALKVTQVLSGDHDAWFAIYDACRVAMAQEGLHQWTPEYPSHGIISEDIAKGQLYGILVDGVPVAAIALSEEQEPEYAGVDWSATEERVLVVHRLAVHPNHQHGGMAMRLMDFAEAFAKRNGYGAIRLDAYSGNPRVLRLYARRGYVHRGTVRFLGRELPFHCLEKSIPLP